MLHLHTNDTPLPDDLGGQRLLLGGELQLFRMLGGRLPRTIADLAQHHREAKHAIEANLLSSVANGLLSVKESTWVATCYVQQKQRQYGSHWYNDSMSLLQELRQLRRFISDGWERDRFEGLIEALQLCIKQQS